MLEAPAIKRLHDTHVYRHKDRVVVVQQPQHQLHQLHHQQQQGACVRL